MSSVAEASTAEDSPFEVHYFPGEQSVTRTKKTLKLEKNPRAKMSKSMTISDPELNFWMFAMIGLGGAFIAFVGFSLYIMW
jgi:hypothetical protein